ncbi:hypothetical protein WBJ53_15435 [Spirosoma sp. SC4-14]|uniref:hypothetical protein n=1 Tax=Spirosoma sp. SC4-14 TaxID=3128900 RepID=UPI0030CD3990
MLLPLMNKLTIAALLSSATLGNPVNPTMPKGLSFDASAYVTINNQIRVAVNKKAETPVVILLKSSDNQVIYRQSIDRKTEKYAVKLNVDELADGKYELEVASKEGSIRKELNLTTKPVKRANRVIAME